MTQVPVKVITTKNRFYVGLLRPIIVCTFKEWSGGCHESFDSAQGRPQTASNAMLQLVG